ncbi:MAG: PIN domain-containing protein [bacterium]|nr:PIN domain-containing protein [bacterium]
MYLIDTNIWLSALYQADHADAVKHFLGHFTSDKFYTTAFSLNTISMILKREKRDDVLTRFLLDLFVDGAVTLIHLHPEDIKRILRTMDQYGLDYHDAHQYVALEKYNLTMVSFNEAFEGTERGRKTPMQIMALL